MLLIEMRNECLFFRLENGITVLRAEMTRSVIIWLTKNSRLISCKLWLFLMFHRDSWVWFYFTLWKYCPLIVWKTFSNSKKNTEKINIEKERVQLPILYTRLTLLLLGFFCRLLLTQCVRVFFSNTQKFATFSKESIIIFYTK